MLSISPLLHYINAGSRKVLFENWIKPVLVGDQIFRYKEIFPVGNSN